VSERPDARQPEPRDGTGDVGASTGFQPLGGETVYSGRLVDVRIERFRHADGEVVTREIVRHRGAVGIVAHDEERVWLVRQPREAVAEPALLEIPAGRLDVDGEEPADAARRELAEEIGRGARSWEPILTYYSGAGFTDERVHLFLATDLHEASAESEENERIEIVPWPLASLQAVIEQSRDAKTLIGLLWLARRLNA
jgi:8-oxo-dGTP pyrophosphatase MutT (NUDIX family)